MIKFLDKKLFRYLSVFLFLNSLILPVKSSSALAAWAINTNGVLELRTKSNTNLKAYFRDLFETFDLANGWLRSK